MTYEWNPQKAAANRNKHRLDFEEASSVFLDPLALTFPDPAHSVEEHREITIGLTMKGRLAFISPCDRKGRIRIISARLVTRAEHKQYEEGIGNWS